ncbi:Hint domain-containing protein [Rhodoblastus sp.]|uniref:Hint domain-containing protein n=1 Tax=Rhodoblastus sp. TaxID=1962975 RepID=UPI0035B36D12
MANISWKNVGTNGAWNVAGNWTGTSPARIPTSSDSVTIGSPGAIGDYTVTLSGTAGAASSLSLSGSSFFQNTTTLAISADTLTVSGAITINAYAAIVTTGTSTINTATLTGAGTVKVSSGALTLNATTSIDASGSATTFDLETGTTLTITGGGTFGAASINPTLTMNGTGASFINVVTAQANVHLGAITGFDGTDKIQLKSFGAGDTYVVSGNTLTIWNAAHSSSQSYTFASGTAMSAITVANTATVDTITICFMAGSMIRTPDGEAAIETLKPGDLVLTAEGVAKPVNWLGRQTVSTLFADPARVLPIRVKAGALAENTPSRDLLVSPDHALLVEGVMIQAGALVNGASIIRETHVPQVFVYYHVELDDHSLILAENTPAETFIDNVDRMNFDNWHEFQALYPEGKSVEELPFPRAKSRRQVPVYIRVALAARAETIDAAESAAA